MHWLYVVAFIVGLVVNVVSRIVVPLSVNRRNREQEIRQEQPEEWEGNGGDWTDEFGRPWLGKGKFKGGEWRGYWRENGLRMA